MNKVWLRECRYMLERFRKEGDKVRENLLQEKVDAYLRSVNQKA